MMSKWNRLATAAVFALVGVGVNAAPAQQPYGGNDRNTQSRQIRPLLRRIDLSTAKFSRSLNQALVRTPVNTGREEDRIQNLLAELTETTDHLADHIDRGEIAPAYVEDVLLRASRVDAFMRRHRLTTQADSDWAAVRQSLDALARTQNVAWDWNNIPQGVPGGYANLADRLTGTYQLERSDDARQAVEQAARSLPAGQRQRASQRLIARLDSPREIALDRNGRSVSIASTIGPRVTFDVDGRTIRDQDVNGRSIETRAAFNGDQLLVTTTGNRGNDFTVTFEPLDNGRSLRVTRRIIDDDQRLPVTVQSYYRKVSDQARWSVYSGAGNADRDIRDRRDDRGIRDRNDRDNRDNRDSRDMRSGDIFTLPEGGRIVATLDEPLSTRTTRDKERVTMTVVSPPQYQGAVIEGFVSRLSQSGPVSGRAELSLNLQSVRLPNGRTSQFAGVVESVKTPDGASFRVDNEGTVGTAGSRTEQTIQRGAIGAALGAIIGAIAGGGQGAAIGAAVGAGGGAATVIAGGRDQLDLPRGTELTVAISPSGGFDRR